jgi:hypothetical protein
MVGDIVAHCLNCEEAALLLAKTAEKTARIFPWRVAFSSGYLAIVKFTASVCMEFQESTFSPQILAKSNAFSSRGS